MSKNDDEPDSSAESIYKAAQRLVKVGQDPQPGTATWHMAMESAYRELVNEVFKWHSPDGDQHG